MSTGTFVVLGYGFPILLVTLWWLRARRKPDGRQYVPVVVVSITLLMVLGVVTYWVSIEQGRTTLFEVVAAGSEGVSVGALAPVREFEVVVEHPDVEHRLYVEPTFGPGPHLSEAGAPVMLLFDLVDPDGQVLISEERTFDVTTCSAGRRSTRSCWRSWDGTFTPLRTGPHLLTLTVVTVGVPAVRLHVVDPEKTDGARGPVF